MLCIPLARDLVVVNSSYHFAELVSQIIARKKKKKNKTKQKGEEGEDNGVKTTSGLKEYSQENQFEERSPNLNKVTPTMNEHDDKLHNDM